MSGGRGGKWLHPPPLDGKGASQLPSGVDGEDYPSPLDVIEADWMPGC